MKRFTVPLLKMLARYVRARNSERADVNLQVGALEQLVQLPVLFEDRYGLSYLLYPDQSPGIYFQYGGNYEVDETKFCLKYVREGMTTFDVGANIGLYTLLFAKLAGATGSVHSFEAETVNFERLRQNVGLNGLNQVHANHLAVFSEPGSIELNVYAQRFAAWHTIGSPKLPDPDNPAVTVAPIRTEKVPAVALDGYCADADIASIDLLKVDVEGAEMDVLLGCERLFAEGRIRCILFEASRPQIEGMGRSPEEVFVHLRGKGFTIYSLASGELGQEVASSDSRYENFVAFSDAADAMRMGSSGG